MYDVKTIAHIFVTSVKKELFRESKNGKKKKSPVKYIKCCRHGTFFILILLSNFLMFSSFKYPGRYTIFLIFLVVVLLNNNKHLHVIAFLTSWDITNCN